jgi:hypothetical protein
VAALRVNFLQPQYGHAATIVYVNPLRILNAELMRIQSQIQMPTRLRCADLMQMRMAMNLMRMESQMQP